MKGICLTVVAAVATLTFAGCQTTGSGSALNNSHGCPTCAVNHEQDYGGLLNSACRNPVEYRHNHHGVAGIVGCVTKESSALVHCLLSKRWEGDYPYGICGPWVGNWDCCCSSGRIDDPWSCCGGTCCCEGGCVECSGQGYVTGHNAEVPNGENSLSEPSELALHE